MSKLIIPAAELIGTPLTTEELKGILAGYSINKKCNCSYERSGPKDAFSQNPHYYETIKDIKDSAECDAACASLCDSHPIYRCVDFQWEFVTTESGPN